MVAQWRDETEGAKEEEEGMVCLSGKPDHCPSALLAAACALKAETGTMCPGGL